MAKLLPFTLVRESDSTWPTLSRTLLGSGRQRTAPRKKLGLVSSISSKLSMYFSVPEARCPIEAALAQTSQGNMVEWPRPCPCMCLCKRAIAVQATVLTANHAPQVKVDLLLEDTSQLRVCQNINELAVDIVQLHRHLKATR